MHKTTFSHRLLRFLPNSLCSHTHANLHRRTGRTPVKLPTTDHFYHHTLAGIFLRSSPEHAANIEWQSLHTNQPPEVCSCLVCVQRSTRCGQSGECMWRSLVGGFIKAVRTPTSNFWTISGGFTHWTVVNPTSLQMTQLKQWKTTTTKNPHGIHSAISCQHVALLELFLMISCVQSCLCLALLINPRRPGHALKTTKILLQCFLFFSLLSFPFPPLPCSDSFPLQTARAQLNSIRT